MKIGIDVSQIIYGTGVSRYTRQLIRNLAKIDYKNRYLLFFSSLRGNYNREKLPNNFIDFEFKLPPSFLNILWNDLHFINIDNFIGKIDIYHSSDWIQAPSRAKKITTVHDVSFLHFPQFFPQKIIKTHHRRLYWVKRECDLVMVDSQSTKQDLISFLNFEESKIKVVYLGVEERFKVNKQKDKEKILAVKNKYGISGEYILTVATQEPRKNIKLVIKAFSQLPANKSWKLVLAGKAGWGEEVKNSRNVLSIGFVKDQDLPYLYAGASCFVYPSHWEGFGLPVLEAMSAGCPVITSNNSSLAEISGQAALLVAPTNENDLIKRLKEILENKKLAQKLSQSGQKQAASFTWEKTAQGVLDCYQKLF